jgi:TolA-binding protein
MGYTAAGQKNLERRIRQLEEEIQSDRQLQIADVATINQQTGKIQRLEKALQSIANLWPIETSAKIANVSGINDGKSRAIIAEGAVTIARKALGIEKLP